jgi:hypothetical protein
MEWQVDPPGVLYLTVCYILRRIVKDQRAVPASARCWFVPGAYTLHMRAVERTKRILSSLNLGAQEPYRVSFGCQGNQPNYQSENRVVFPKRREGAKKDVWCDSLRMTGE